MNKTIYVATNRKNKTVTQLHGFSCWEHVQSYFVFGFMMPDNKPADAIGRCESVEQMQQHAQKHGYTILS